MNSGSVNKAITSKAKGTATVAKGTSVQLLLLQPLQSGQSKENERVDFMVAENVTSNGKIVIPKGSRASGKITWSRGENTFSALKNEPARLAVDLESIQVEGGGSVDIEPKKGEKAYQFDRSNTGKQNFISRLERVWNEDSERERLRNVLDSLQRGSDFSNEKDRENVAAAARELGLDNLANTISGPQYNQLKGALDDLQNQGHDLRRLSGSDILFAALEYRTLLGGLQTTVGSMLKGRQIRAYPGTIVEAQVAEKATVPVN